MRREPHHPPPHTTPTTAPVSSRPLYVRCRYIRSDEGYHTIKGAGTIQLWKKHGGAIQTFEFGVTTTPSDVPRQLPDAAEVLFARNQVLLALNELQSYSIHLNSNPHGRSVLGNVTLADTRPISDDDNTFGR